MLLEEQTAADYTGRALSTLHAAGCLGAMLWCFADYAPATWDRPPLDEARHERSFGLWRSDGSAKPALEAVAAFAGAEQQGDLREHAWIDIDTEEFGRDPGLAHPPPVPPLSRTDDHAQVSRPRTSWSGMAAMPLPRSEKP